jgi:hypothetical protein
MNVKAIGHSALIVTAGLWMCFAAPIRAEDRDADTSDPAATSESTASDPIATNKVVKKPAKKPAVAHSHPSGKAASDAAPSAMPSPAAKAYAPIQAGDSPADSALKAMSVQAESDPNNPPADAPAANTDQGSADQLNDADRSLSADKALAPAPTLTMAVAQTPSAASDSDSTWQRTSLLGKIFVAFGGLLTIASAARMFMA